MSKKSAYLIKLLVATLFLFGFPYLPAPAPITSVGMQVIGIFIGTIFLMSTVDTGWPAFLCIALLANTSLFTFNTAISGSFGNWIPIFVMAILMLGTVLVDSGVANQFVSWFMTRPFLQGKPWLFTAFFLFSSLILGYFMDVFALIAFYMSTITIICTQLGYEKGSKYPTGLVIGVGFMTAIAGAATPFQAHIAFVMGQYSVATDGGTIPTFSYIAWGFVPILLTFVAYMLIFRFILKPDLSNFAALDITSLQKDKQPLSKQQLCTVTIYGGVVLLWILPGLLQLLNILPGVTAAINALGIVFPAFVGIALMSAVRINGQPLMRVGKAAKSIPWPVVFLVASNTLLGSALSHDDAGISAWFEQVAGPLVEGVSPMLFVFLIAVVTLILTNLGSNSVAAVIAFQLANLLLPSGLDLCVVAVVIGFSIRAAFCLPTSCTNISVIYGEEWCNTKLILPLGTLLCAICALIITFVGYPLTAVFF